MKLRLFRPADGVVADIEIDIAADTMETLQILAEAELDVPLGAQRLSIRQVPLPSAPGTKLSALGFSEGDLIQVDNVATTAAAHLAPPPPVPATTATTTTTTTTTAQQQQQDETLLRLFGAVPPAQQPQRQPAPSLPGGQPVDNELLRLFQGGGGGGGAGGGAAGMGARVNSDDPEVQRRLLEEIQRRNIEENLANAIEYTPEAFARVVMLYVNAEVNGVPLAAFVDSGAQMTIMSEEIAERCNLTRLIDRKFKGMAHGVGQTEIVGRVHMVMVKVAGICLPMSITVLKAKNMDFLLGLDQLRRHQMMIDLKHNELRVDEDHAVKFLSEHELPEHIREGIPTHEDKQATTASSSAPPAAAASSSAGAVSSDAAVSKKQPPSSSSTSTTTTAQPQQPSSAAASSGSSSSAPTTTATATAQLTPEQREQVTFLREICNVSEEVAVGALVAMNWNADEAVNILSSP